MHSSDPRAPAPTLEAPILVVEDDPQLRQTIEFVLRDEGFPVVTAADGLEAVERARSLRPALVLLDWGLPLLDGGAVADAIHQSYRDAVPIVLVTADDHSPEKARRARARDFVSKPFELDHLVSTVRRTLASP